MRAPMRSSTSSSPVRRGLSADVVDRQLGAGQQRRRDDERRGRGEVAGHVDLAELRAARPGRRRRGVACRVTRTPAASSISSVWSRVGSGSTTVVWPRRVQAGEQHARLHLRARHRQLVADPAQLAALDRRAAACRRSSRRVAPICAQRLGDRAPSGGGAATRRRSARSGPPGRRGSRRAAAASVPALPQSIGPSGSRSPRRPTPWTRSASTSSSSTSTPSARTAAIVDSVSPERPKPRTRVSPSPIAPSSTRAVRDRLVAGNARCGRAAPRPARPRHSASTGETTTP